MSGQTEPAVTTLDPEAEHRMLRGAEALAKYYKIETSSELDLAKAIALKIHNLAQELGPFPVNHGMIRMLDNILVEFRDGKLSDKPPVGVRLIKFVLDYSYTVGNVWDPDMRKFENNALDLLFAAGLITERHPLPEVGSEEDLRNQAGFYFDPNVNKVRALLYGGTAEEIAAEMAETAPKDVKTYAFFSQLVTSLLKPDPEVEAKLKSLSDEELKKIAFSEPPAVEVAKP